jgi:hypothetical protein
MRSLAEEREEDLSIITPLRGGCKFPGYSLRARLKLPLAGANALALGMGAKRKSRITKRDTVLAVTPIARYFSHLESTNIATAGEFTWHDAF